MVDETKDELSRNGDVVWHPVHCSNYGMLHSYSTVVRTEKGAWFPSGSLGDEEEI